MALESFCLGISCLLTFSLCSAAYFKELLVTRDHVPPPVLILSNRCVSIALASLILLATENELALRAPLPDFVMFSVFNEAGTHCGYEMLKYVSFPVQEMAKSCKMLPTLIIGYFWNGTEYRWFHFLQSILAFICVAIMCLSDDHQKAGRAEQQLDVARIAQGAALLIAHLMSNGFTSQYQDSLYERHHGLSEIHMMLGGNLAGLLLTALTLPVRARTFSLPTLRHVLEPRVLWKILCHAFFSALGQYCIYLAVRVLDPLGFSWLMTVRKLISVFLSLLWLGHGISATKLTCIAAAFGVMSWRPA